METAVVEVLNPMTTFGSTTMNELAQLQGTCACVINASFRTKFSQTNPEYTSSIFLSYYPEFTNLLVVNGDNNATIEQYVKLFNTFAEMANNCLDYRRFGYDWYYLMSAFVAHYMSLALSKLYALQNNSTSGDIQTVIGALANQSTGLAVKESLGGEEIQTEQMINVGLFKSAGNYMTTPYGREFWDKYIGYSRNFFRGVY